MSFLPKTRVVVPFDFSERCLQALGVAMTLVEDPSRLHVIHVLPQLSPMDPGVLWDAASDARRKQHALDALKENTLRAGCEEARTEVLIGEPARTITERASELEAELIVLPSHGRTGAARLLIGSVAERIVRFAHCPVLVLRD